MTPLLRALATLAAHLADRIANRLLPAPVIPGPLPTPPEEVARIRSFMRQTLRSEMVLDAANTRQHAGVGADFAAWADEQVRS